MTPQIQLLKEMRSLLAKPENWYQGYYAADRFGKETAPLSPTACKFCLVGAGHKIQTENPSLGNCWTYGPISDAAVELYPNHAAIFTYQGVRGVSTPNFNDHPSTTHEMVLAVLDRAIENLIKEIK